MMCHARCSSKRGEDPVHCCDDSGELSTLLVYITGHPTIKNDKSLPLRRRSTDCKVCQVLGCSGYFICVNYITFTVRSETTHVVGPTGPFSGHAWKPCLEQITSILRSFGCWVSQKGNAFLNKYIHKGKKTKQNQEGIELFKVNKNAETKTNDVWAGQK